MDQYKDIFGKPNEGVHSARIFGLAATDLFLTGAAAAIIWPKHWIFAFFVLIILACMIHKLFGVESALNKKIKEEIFPLFTNNN